ncbi:hypothetical protein [Rubritalea profundi]|uniref:HD domain-containing protein n=1 Tax=Rubritalea profundi TaxID=1658618 RepID=A0A2S7TXJ9_9BACT|nr:hypothetical protein [Rubritalea profundi]PQJ27439.1 hypothetical protein BSZ32_02295 [Rubritalea profundi]
MFIHDKVDDQLVQDVLSRKHQIEYSVHGLQHWQRVERNGLFLSEREGGDDLVVSLFALFHDSQRLNDFEDPEHGSRGATLATEFYDQGRLCISEAQLQTLTEACRDHTESIYSDNATIRCCWDGDRLDLTRISVIPDSEMLNTATAKEIADTMDYSILDRYRSYSR